MIAEEDLKRVTFLLEKTKTQVLPKEEYVYLQRLLFKRESLYPGRYVYPLCKTTLTGDKIMFISDTHHGNEKYNRKFEWIAYNVALQLNIKTVVHAGDLIESCAWERNKGYEEICGELETAVSYMPDEILTRMLVGNHEYWALFKYLKMIDNFFKYPKLDILGMGKVLLDWDGLADIRVNHPTYKLKDSNEPESNGIIIFEGHHHYFNFHEDRRTIDLPALNDDTRGKLSHVLWELGYNYIPLFIVGSKQDINILLFELYCLSKDEKHIAIGEKIEVNTETKQLRLYK